MTIKWHKLDSGKEWAVSHYELLIPNSEHAEMGWGIFVEYFKYRCEYKQIKMTFKDKTISLTVASFKEGKKKINEYILNNI